MIEFKAECGHTVRTKDEDAGGVVSCSYCGRETPVPDSQNSDLDFLFSDVESGDGATPAIRRGRQRPKKGLFSRRHRTTTQVDPFSIVLRMCYAAALLTIVFLVGKEFVVPLFEEGGVQSRGTQAPSRGTRTTTEDSRPATTPTKPSSRATRSGLLAGGGCSGIFLASIPARAEVFLLPADHVPEFGTIRNEPGCIRTFAGEKWETRWEGEYVVEVSLPWSHKELMDNSLPYTRQYTEFRKAIHATEDEDERSHLVNAFFIPDESESEYVYASTRDQLHIARRYPKVKIEKGHGTVIRALFLPRITSGQGTTFELNDLINRYIPKDAKYGFDQSHVEQELAFWEVPQEDHQYVITALRRIGIIAYPMGNNEARLFTIDPCDGSVVTDAVPDRR